MMVVTAAQAPDCKVHLWACSVSSHGHKASHTVHLSSIAERLLPLQSGHFPHSHGSSHRRTTLSHPLHTFYSPICPVGALVLTGSVTLVDSTGSLSLASPVGSTGSVTPTGPVGAVNVCSCWLSQSWTTSSHDQLGPSKRSGTSLAASSSSYKAHIDTLRTLQMLATLATPFP